ncbi:hypothetical protein SAMN05421863_108510 [Nitrosomonas communis]|uniref:Uncharacterized protein n=1 Tax=Nitrosomonas communis TaxID=44574 RepID=A0A1I4VK11_9PROT|nr:hypothetical protein SAMN05421863_108510 [Nitrosomonas communis]
MSAYEADIYYTVDIINPYHQPVFVTGNIKYYSAIFEGTGIFEICFCLRMSPSEYAGAGKKKAQPRVVDPISF